MSAREDYGNYFDSSAIESSLPVNPRFHADLELSPERDSELVRLNRSMDILEDKDSLHATITIREGPDGREEIIDEKKLMAQIAKNKGAGKLTRLIQNSFWLIIHECAVKIVVSLLIMNFYQDRNDDLEFLSLFLAIDDALKALVYALFFYFRPVQFRDSRIYRIDFLRSIGYVSVFFGGYLYLAGSLKFLYTVIFLLPQFAIFFGFMARVKSKKSILLTWFARLQLLEPVQNLVIYFNLLFFGWNLWSAVLMYYYFASVIFITATTGAGLLAIVAIAFFVFRTQNILGDLIMYFFFGSIVFYFVWSGFFYFFIFLGVKGLLSKQMFPRVATTDRFPDQNDLLYTSCIQFIFCGVMTIFWLSLSYMYLRKKVVKSLLTKERLLTISKFNLEINLGLKMMTGSIFIDSDATTLEEDGLDEEERMQMAASALTQCILCYEGTGDILIEPCHHSGICHKCLKKSLRKSNNCPFCGRTITLCKIIGHDPARKTFLVVGIFDETKESDQSA